MINYILVLNLFLNKSIDEEQRNKI